MTQVSTKLQQLKLLFITAANAATAAAVVFRISLVPHCYVPGI